jgi:hypothetical protein
VVDKNNLKTFSKFSEESDSGDLYTPPAWNQDQREQIIDMVETLPFTDIPNKNFFKISFDSDVQHQMMCALKIVKMKAASFIFNLLEKAITPKVNLIAVELKTFAEYLDIVKNNKLGATDLKHYIKILQWNDFFKLSYPSEEVEKLSEEMILLSKFTKQNQQNSMDQNDSLVKEDWIRLIDKSYKNIISILDNIYEEAKYIIYSGGNVFNKFESKKFITTKGTVEESEKLSSYFRILEGKYRDKIDIQKLHGNITRYGKAETESQFDRFEEISYEEKQTVQTSEAYDVVSYHSVQEDIIVTKYSCCGSWVTKEQTP